MTIATERGKAAGDHRRLLDRRLLSLLEVAKQPPSRDPRMALPILERDQGRQLEGVGQAEPRELLRRRLG